MGSHVCSLNQAVCLPNELLRLLPRAAGYLAPAEWADSYARFNFAGV